MPHDGQNLMSVGDALVLIGRHQALPGIDEIDLAGAMNRVLARDMTARAPITAYASAAMDGYAFRFSDLEGGRRMAIGPRVAAGHPATAPLPSGSAARIFTGGMMPDGADTVALQEDCQVGESAILLPEAIVAGANCRAVGEDAMPGSVILAAGTRLRPQDIGMAAAAGYTALPVRRRLRVALFSTGDELREPGTPLPPGCLYDSNRYTIAAALAGLGASVSDIGILPDAPRSIRAALSAAAERHDLILSTGGVSEGEEDHVRAVLQDVGSLDFWKLALKPGKPIAVGTIAGTSFVGLPGNPVSAMIAFWLIVRPLLLRLMGAEQVAESRIPVFADFDHRRRPGRREYLRVRVRRDERGRLMAAKYHSAGSALISSLTWSNGLAEIREERGDVAIGDPLDFLPYQGLLS